MSEEMYWNAFLAIVQHSFPDYEPTDRAKAFAEYGRTVGAPVTDRAAGWISRLKALGPNHRFTS